MADPTSALAGTIRAAGTPAPPWDVATVTSATLTGGRVAVDYDGTATTLPKLRQYTPVAGDTVVVGRIGAALFIVGALG